MSKIPTLRESATARLHLYKLLREKLSSVQRRLLDAQPELWRSLLLMLEAEIASQENEHHITSALKKAFLAIEIQCLKDLNLQMEHVTGGENSILRIKPTKLLERFIKEHLALVKSVQGEQLERIGLNINQGIRDGLLQKDIAKQIQVSTGMCKKRAKLIARAAPLQYSGELSKHYQTSAGINKYRWVTSRDERVRKSHKSREGKIYDWNGPGPHPRSEVLCRCDAVPVVDY